MPGRRRTLTVLVLSITGIALALASIALGASPSQISQNQVPPAYPTSTPTPDLTHAIVPGVASDGFPPTATPTPLPKFAGNCFRPRTESDLPLLPASENSVFQNCQVIAFYGHPTVPGLGVLGQGATEAMLTALVEQAKPYDETNGSRDTVLALHVIAGVASASQTADGTWVTRLSGAQIEELIAIAEENDLLLILDTQMGTSTVEKEFVYFKPFLRHPRVHLAMDPEWHMPAGIAPGSFIGSMTADEINRAQALLDELVREDDLPNKMLVIHQFQGQMIRDKATLADYPGVDLVIDQDGVGGKGPKVGNYNVFIDADGAEHGGMKVFYTEDLAPLLTPAEVNALVPQPDLVIYQ